MAYITQLRHRVVGLHTTMADLSTASTAAAAAMNRSPPPRSAAVQSPAHAATQALRTAERRQTSDPALAVLRALTDLKVCSLAFET